MIKNKKAMQMAISTFVGLVLGGFMLMAGIALLATIISNTEEIRDQTMERIENEIKEAFTSNNPIYIHENPVTPKDNLAIFGVGIYNIYSNEREFKIKINEPEEYDSGDEHIAFLEPGKINARDRHITLIMIPTKNLDRGQHSFTLNITSKNESGTNFELYDTKKILYVKK